MTLHQIAEHRDAISECKACCVRRASLCSAVPDNGLTRLSRNRQAVRFAKRRTIVCEGDTATSFFNVTSGVVKLLRSSPDGRTQIVGFCVAGDFFATPESEKYTITAVAVTDVEICLFSRAQLGRLISECPGVLARLFEMTCERVTANEHHAFLLGRQTARERVVDFLLSYARRTSGDRQEPLRFVNLPMPRVDIADYLGLTIETVCRVMSKLEEEGLIEVETARTVRFSDLHALTRVAEG